MGGSDLGGLFVGESPMSATLDFSSQARFPRGLFLSPAREIKVWLPGFWEPRG